jgi:hypothetical protein
LLLRPVLLFTVRTSGPKLSQPAAAVLLAVPRNLQYVLHQRHYSYDPAVVEPNMVGFGLGRRLKLLQ